MLTDLKMKTDVIDFLQHSNWIEGVTDSDALDRAVKAWELMETVTVLTVGAILECHKILMQGCDLGMTPSWVGRFRTCNVRVGNHVAPPFDQVGRLMEQWLMNFSRVKTTRIGDKVFSSEAKIKKAHVAFEKIHPFQDGNGRVGRIIMNWQRMSEGLPVLVIREEERFDYYKWFKNK